MLEFKKLNLSPEEQEGLSVIAMTGVDQDIEVYMVNYLTIGEKVEIINTIVGKIFNIETDIDHNVVSINGTVDTLKTELLTKFLVVNSYLMNVIPIDSDDSVFETYDALSQMVEIDNVLNRHPDIMLLKSLLNAKISDIMITKENLDRRAEFDKTDDLLNAVEDLAGLFREREVIEIKAMEVELLERQKMLQLMPDNPEDMQTQQATLMQSIEAMNGIEEMQSTIAKLSNKPDSAKVQNIREVSKSNEKFRQDAR